MIHTIKKWYKRTFCVITKQECITYGLQFYCNIDGDQINHLNCRSLWTDNKGRSYRCSSLHYAKTVIATKKLRVIWNPDITQDIKAYKMSIGFTDYLEKHYIPYNTKDQTYENRIYKNQDRIYTIEQIMNIYTKQSK